MPQNPLSFSTTNAAGQSAGGKVDGQARLETNPHAGTSPAVVHAVGTIATTGTFQAALAANPSRSAGGAIINTGAHAMSVQFVATTGTVLTGSWPVGAGSGTVLAAGTLLLPSAFPGAVYTGAISIAGTATDTFVTIENS